MAVSGEEIATARPCISSLTGEKVAAGETEAESRALHSALWKVQRMNF